MAALSCDCSSFALECFKDTNERRWRTTDPPTTRGYYFNKHGNSKLPLLDIRTGKILIQCNARRMHSFFFFFFLFFFNFKFDIPDAVESFVLISEREVRLSVIPALTV